MRLSWIAFVSAAGLLAAAMMAPNSPAPTVKANKYIGAKKCKNCHSSEEGGDAYGHWEKSKHHLAFETLGTDEAKASAAKKGVAGNPQEAPECLKCHVTAYGEDEKMTKSLKAEDGIECETCHGPGGDHMKARMTAAANEDTSPPAPGEMISNPGAATCVKCHNEESPNYKPFCYKEFLTKIRHLDPRKKRTEEELKIPCDCPKCKGG